MAYFLNFRLIKGTIPIIPEQEGAWWLAQAPPFRELVVDRRNSGKPIISIQ